MKTIHLAKQVLFGLGILAGTSLAGSAALAAYPDRPITVVVPFGAGSGTDAIARMVAQGLAEKLGQPAAVANKPGAGGIIGASFVANSEPDGYTLLVATSGPMAANASLYNKLAYDPQADFEPVSIVAKRPMVVLASKEAKAHSFSEIVAEAKANPGKINFGSSNTTSRVFVELLKKSQDIQVETVLYKDVSSLMTDLISGRVSYAFEDAGPSLTQIKADRVNLVAVSDKKRAGFAPDTPATSEYGFDDRGLVTWYAVFAPKNTPPEVVAQLNKTINAYIQGPEMKAMAKEVGLELTNVTPSEFKEFQKAEIIKWKHLVDLTGVKLD
ncbi:tripartite tricarboxylate transporter substrate binding protein [Bordetella sp. BOR01]|uniref:Bug family tripartite tricarboxylate transporter substrate binding protein n=1 Tax=Bordetella sp. BOR01 TaxID=2854779 RepID=UPI001C43763A|nr:tripartite tricarboxylate transporter substrate binding protein [Bordetella sp. BOR01]MBV7481494.1 tripartite tricarboxylate transporter substrate binding protein [Bordetella sp. BOR01]